MQTVQPRGVKTTDDLVLNATSIADQKYEVEYEFTIKELNKTLKATANTNSQATVNFGKLKMGTYHAVIKGKHESQSDAIEYEFNIVESTQEVKDKKTVNINKDTTIKPSKNPVVLEIYNKNMKQYLDYIDFIESTLTQRLDTQIAYNQVQEIKDKYYGTKTVTNYINLNEYIDNSGYLKNLQNSKKNIVLTALISNYAKQYYSSAGLEGYGSNLLGKKDNIYEVYLLASANKESVLLDLKYLKDGKDVTNYNKLLVTLSFEFLGDYKNAKELYNTIKLSNEEKEEYKSLTAIIETYINKKEAVKKINDLIKNKPSDEYLRFAILSFFENNSQDIAKEDTVKIVGKDLNENVTINGMQIKTLTVNNEDLDEIKFETESNDLVVSYYYQTLLENVNSKNISKDINIKINGKLKKNSNITLIVTFDKNIEGEVKIALPNSLRLAQSNSEYNYNKYYLVNNQIDYITFFKNKKCSKMEIPLIVTAEGNYKFENIVTNYNGIYHISNSMNLKIEK